MSDYYNTCAFPKPGNSRKKKKENGYKEKPNRYCYYTGQPCAERHELFGGTGNRQNSIDHGLQIDLHPLIHNLFHGVLPSRELLQELDVPEMFPDPLSWAQKELEKHRKHAQEKWELQFRAEHGFSKAQAREAWMQLIGVNYLDH